MKFSLALYLSFINMIYMINIIALQYLGVPKISFILLAYTKHCSCHSGETHNMVLQSPHCYSSSPVKANIISFPDLITTFEY